MHHSHVVVSDVVMFVKRTCLRVVVDESVLPRQDTGISNGGMVMGRFPQILPRGDSCASSDTRVEGASVGRRCG